MTYKQFLAWCEDRSCDGCWGFTNALICLDIISTINHHILPRKKEKEWQKIADSIVKGIVEPTNKVNAIERR